MKILIADVFMPDPNLLDWKEGYELCYAFRNRGHDCDVAGPRTGQIPDTDIPLIAQYYDLIIICDNYPWDTKWRWWNWSEIKTPKLFWAIDSHLIDYKPWILHSKIDYIAFNNPEPMEYYNLPNSFWMIYGVSKKHQLVQYTDTKTRDIVFLGSLMEERKRLVEKFGIEYVRAFGPDYIREMQASKIVFNHSTSLYGKPNVNSKFLEILSSGSFMLTDYNDRFHKFVDYNADIEKMFYYSDDDLAQKIEYYLKNEDEREQIAKKVKDYMYENHSWENRVDLILSNINK